MLTQILSINGESCRQFPISLFLVQRKCLSIRLDVYITPHFNPKRSGKRSTKALLVADGNLWGCPSCQAGRELRAADITAPSCPGCRVLRGHNPFLPPPHRATQPQPCLWHCSVAQCMQPSKRTASGRPLCFLPKGIKCIGSGKRRLKDVGAVSPQLWKNTSPKRKPWHFSCKYTDKSAQGHKPAINTQT